MNITSWSYSLILPNFYFNDCNEFKNFYAMICDLVYTYNKHWTVENGRTVWPVGYDNERSYEFYLVLLLNTATCNRKK